MTIDQFIDTLRSNGFSAGDTLSIICYFLTDLDKVTSNELNKAIPVFKRALAQMREREDRNFEKQYED